MVSNAAFLSAKFLIVSLDFVGLVGAASAMTGTMLVMPEGMLTPPFPPHPNEMTAEVAIKTSANSIGLFDVTRLFACLG